MISASNVWMQHGVGNNLKTMNFNQLYSKLGQWLCTALPGFHAFTGCDYNPALFRKGNKRPFHVLMASREYQEAFEKLADLKANRYENVLKQIEQFVCRFYSLKKINEVNGARFTLFQNTYNFKNTSDYFRFTKKKFDGSSLPPCRAELKKHLLRAAYISNIRRNALKKIATELIIFIEQWMVESRWTPRNDENAGPEADVDVTDEGDKLGEDAEASLNDIEDDDNDLSDDRENESLDEF
ncbi:unnamed protein product [Ceutorhynchus assimilis]|uniref:Uncharacterized protein n=1 Tax=Ceutorhynchus assimilis TaxID=467358 RepID=A0A9N9QJF4_9CUCU|nr:unnamed protein product [Ceutorhynchus assimilis]